MDVKKYIQSWADKYKFDLTEDIMPFWLTHGLAPNGSKLHA